MKRFFLFALVLFAVAFVGCSPKFIYQGSSGIEYVDSHETYMVGVIANNSDFDLTGYVISGWVGYLDEYGKYKRLENGGILLPARGTSPQLLARPSACPIVIQWVGWCADRRRVHTMRMTVNPIEGDAALWQDEKGYWKCRFQQANAVPRLGGRVLDWAYVVKRITCNWR